MNNNLDIKKDILCIIFNFILPIIVFVFWDIFFRIATLITIEDSVIVISNLNLISIIFGIVVYGIILSFAKRTDKAIKIIYIISFVFYLINQLRIIYTEEPFTLYDFKFLNKLSDLNKLVKGMYTFKIIISLLIFFIGVGVFTILFKILKKYKCEIKSKTSRVIICGMCILIILGMCYQNQYTKKFFLENFYKNKEVSDYNNHVSNLWFYLSHGVPAGFFGIYLNSLFFQPEDYNEDELEQAFSNCQKENEDYGKPNIIILFSEAFWDISKVDEIKFDKPITENFNNLKKEGKLIDLLSPTFGGLSENVAFEILTGANNTFFPQGYVPMMSILDVNPNPMSIIKELKNNGYYSKMVFGKDYYNTEKVCLSLGFDEYQELEQNENNKKGKYISDEYITNNIISYFENKSPNQKVLYMAETIQNHMPYNEEKYDKSDYSISIKSSKYNKEYNESILAYSQGIYDADKELGRLYNYIKDYKEPTIIIFLGDHLPKISTKSEWVLNKFKYFNTDNEIQNIFNYYNTQALILSNYDIDYEKIPSFMGTDYLLTFIVNNMDIKLSKYYIWLKNVYSSYSALNRLISIDENRNLYYTNYNITEKMKEIYRIRENMQYKFFIKKVK